MSNGIQNGKQSLREFSPRRLSIELDGKIVSPSERVQPLVCKNKLCVNPSHLVFGDEARFWAKVNRLKVDDCWIWIASLDKDMYGKFRLCEDGKKIDIRAHVYSWQLYTGRPVPKGGQVCHKCDHPYCVNPAHLFLGTTQDNTKDRDEKGRQARGETSGNAKHTEQQVVDIRAMHTNGMSISDIGLQLSIPYSTIWSMIHKSWKHI